MHRNYINHKRHGATLIEVALGSFLMAALVVPALRLMQHSDMLGRRHELQQAILFAAEEKLEQVKIALSDDSVFTTTWTSGSGTDVLEKIQLTAAKVALARTRVIADRSIGNSTARLVTVQVDVWDDADGSGRAEVGEIRESLQTQWASP